MHYSGKCCGSRHFHAQTRLPKGAAACVPGLTRERLLAFTQTGAGTGAEKEQSGWGTERERPS